MGGGCSICAQRARWTPTVDISPHIVAYDRRTRVSVRLGDKASHLTNTPCVVFIFGGPGSKKGRIVDDLANAYGFRFINVEDIVFQELPRKLAHIVKIGSVQELRDILEDDPGQVSLEWLLHMVERRIEREDPNANYLIDVVPNLRSLLRSDTLVREDCSDAMQRFETRYPISLALNLSIPADKVVLVKRTYLPVASGDKLKETGGKGDEMDVGLTRRRAVVYERAASPFLRYFDTSGRLLTVDVTCGEPDLIWFRVHEILSAIGFSSRRTVNTVVLFAMDESESNAIDVDKYTMTRVALSTIVDNPNDDYVKLVYSLSRYIDAHSTMSDAFVVLVSGTSLANDTSTLNSPSRCIIFVEVHEAYLEWMLQGSPANFQPDAASKPYKAVCSLENEICLFPLHVPDSFCVTVASQLAASRQL